MTYTLTLRELPGDVVYASAINGLNIVWDGQHTFIVFRNVGTVNDGEYVFIDTFIHVVRDTIEACDAAIAFAHSRKGQAMHRPVRGYVA